MRHLTFVFVFVTILLFLPSCRQQNPFSLQVVEITDCHGVIDSNMASLSSYVKQMKNQYGDDLLLLNCGDILHGSPEAYFAHHADSVKPNVYTDILNYFDFDVITVGNHDFASGSKVFLDVFGKRPSNVINANISLEGRRNDKLDPYKVFHKNGYKIAVLGLVSSGSLEWCQEMILNKVTIYPTEQSARYWVKRIQEKEKPDLLIGLFHTGIGDPDSLSNMNTSGYIARNIPGIDLICCGHDHRVILDSIVNIEGKKVYLMDAGSHAHNIAHACVTFSPKKGEKPDIKVDMEIIPSKAYPQDTSFLNVISAFAQRAHIFYQDSICALDTTIYSKDALKGGCLWMDILHRSFKTLAAVKEYEEVDITFAAPSYDNAIISGPMSINSFLWLYPYDNSLCVVEMTGDEIKKYLEYAYDIRLRPSEHPIYDFDSAGGIVYTVDMSKPYGERISIVKMSDNNFYSGRKYHVAMTSFRAMGGGGHLSKSLGWTQQRMKQRTISRTSESLLNLMLNYYSTHPIDTTALNEWHFVE